MLLCMYKRRRKKISKWKYMMVFEMQKKSRNVCSSFQGHVLKNYWWEIEKCSVDVVKNLKQMLFILWHIKSNARFPVFRSSSTSNEKTLTKSLISLQANKQAHENPIRIIILSKEITKKTKIYTEKIHLSQNIDLLLATQNENI